jgi:hypothetical protein
MRLNPISGRIIELHLAGKTVLVETDKGTGSGCFLMYPWVNRVEENPFLPVQSEYFDGNGLPIHGLYVNDKRDITMLAPSHEYVVVDLVAQKTVNKVPKFKERFTLSKGTLKV